MKAYKIISCLMVGHRELLVKRARHVSKVGLKYYTI